MSTAILFHADDYDSLHSRTLISRFYLGDPMDQLQNATPGHSGQGQIHSTASYNSAINEGSASVETHNSIATNGDSTSSFVPLGNLELRNPNYSIPYLGMRPSCHRSMSPLHHREPSPHIYHPQTPIYALNVQTHAPENNLEASPARIPEPPVVQQPVPLQQFIPRPLHLPRHLPQHLPPPPPYVYHHSNLPGQFPGYGIPVGGAHHYPYYPNAYYHVPAPPMYAPPPSPTILSLPTTTHISILNGQSDFAAWHDRVKALIRHLGWFGHITSMSDPVLPHRPDLSPSTAPLITPQSTQIERDEHTQWWNLDNIIQHVLLARLGSNVRMILPEENFERSARDIYEMLRTNFGSNRRSEGTNIFLDILSLHCNPHQIQDYVSAWQNAVTKMRNCHFIVPGYVLSLLFVKNLPDSLTFSSIRSSLVVFKSPVKSGFSSQNELTVTLTGFDWLYNRKKPHITAKNRLLSVSCS